MTKRYGNVIGIKVEKLEEYIRLHKMIWPEATKILKYFHIMNYSISLKQLDDRNIFLFNYFEYLGQDFEVDMAKMATSASIQKWWSLCQSCQRPLVNSKPGEWWAHMEEIFHLE